MSDYVTRKITVRRGVDQADDSQTVGYVVYFFFGVIEFLLLFRFVFKLTGANPVSTFVSFIYSITQLLIMPFVGIFHQTATPGAEVTAILEPATVVALIVYVLLAWGIAQLIVILSGKLQQ